MRRLLRLPGLVVAGLVGMGVPGAACTVVSAVWQVGRDFDVQALDGERGVAGLVVVVLREEGGRELRAVTDASGRAAFRGVQTGHYVVRAAADERPGRGDGIEVRAAEKMRKTVKLRWPEMRWIGASEVAGVVRWKSRYGEVLAGPDVELVDALTGRAVGKTRLGESGAFDFGPVREGLYLLRFGGTGLGRAQAAIAVQAGSVADPLELAAIEWGCGVAIVDWRECRPQEMRLGTLAGQLADETGAAIAGADIELRDAAGRMVERLRSDSAGEFRTPGEVRGRFGLAVTAPGFQAFEGMVTLGEAEASARVVVTLAVAGCSRAVVR